MLHARLLVMRGALVHRHFGLHVRLACLQVLRALLDIRDLGRIRTHRDALIGLRERCAGHCTQGKQDCQGHFLHCYLHRLVEPGLACPD